MRPGRAARLPLLIAMLLYVGSMAVEPVVHAMAAAAEAPAAPAGIDTDPDPQDPAAEHDCAVCKLTRTFAPASAAPAQALARDVHEAAVLPAATTPRAPPALATIQPRAPPQA